MNKIPFTGFACEEKFDAVIQRIIERVDMSCADEKPADILMALCKYIVSTVHENYIIEDSDKCLDTSIYIIKQLHNVNLKRSIRKSGEPTASAGA